MGYRAHVYLLLLLVVSGSAFRVNRKNEGGLSTQLESSVLDAQDLATRNLDPELQTCVDMLCADLDAEDYGRCVFERCLPEEQKRPENPSTYRQIDPRKSCIETKCAGVKSNGDGAYPRCIFESCIVGDKKWSGSGQSGSGSEYQQVDPLPSCIEVQCSGLEGNDYARCIVDNCMGSGKRDLDERGVDPQCAEAHCAHATPADYPDCIYQKCLVGPGLGAYLQGYMANGLTEEDEEDEANNLVERQVDPLQSCIEAKCYNLDNDKAYGDCIYHKCILGFRLGLMVQRLRKRGGAGFEKLARIGGAVNQRLASRERGVLNERLGSASRNLGANGLDKRDHREQRENADRLATRVMKLHTARRHPEKRSWGDLAGTCVQFHCPGKVPGSLEYSICAQSKCGNYLRR